MPFRHVISVHVPKAAGSSLQRAFRDLYGDALLTDYQDRIADPTSLYNLDPDRFWQQSAAYVDVARRHQVIHGHFHLAKYDGLENAARVTMLRDPLYRALSNYHFWKMSEPLYHPLARYVIEDGLDFKAFCRLPIMRYMYSRIYFAGIDLKRFDLVGIHEDMNGYYGRLETLLGRTLPRHHERKAPEGAYAEDRHELENNARLRRSLTDLFFEDYAIFDRARTLSSSLS